MDKKTRMKKICAIASLIFLQCGLFPAALAQSPQASAKPEKLFASEATLDLSLGASWHQIKRKQEGQASYPATLEYSAEDGRKVSIALTVERRGITRLRVCDFPPIKLRFEKEAVKGTLFRGNKSLKLVTHCDDGGHWQQYYLLEMLSYRIYNLMTERSFRVRPLSVTYMDSDRKSSDGPYFAFLIEDDSDVASRNDLLKLDIPKPRVSQFDPLENSRFSLFQFMIGNTDWSVLNGPSGDECCHNSKLIGSEGATGIFAVPYDFDSAGLVDANYATPSASLHIKHVTERVYRGFCANNSSLPVARAELLQRESQILDLVHNEKRLTPKSSESALDYLKGFFEILRDDSKFASNITAKCRK